MQIDWGNKLDKWKKFKLGGNCKNFIDEIVDKGLINGVIEPIQLSFKATRVSFNNIKVINIGWESGLFHLVALKLEAEPVNFFDFDIDPKTIRA